MSPVLIAIVVIIVMLVIGFFALKISSEKKAKQTYRPPVASKGAALPDVPEESLPAKSGKNLHFCSSCGAPNSDQASYCIKCGNKL